MGYPPQDAPVPPWGSPEPSVPVQHSQEPQSGGLTCPVCGGTSFRQEEGRMQNRWGMGSHIFTIRICDRCSHSLIFHQGSGMAI